MSQNNYQNNRAGGGYYNNQSGQPGAYKRNDNNAGGGQHPNAAGSRKRQVQRRTVDINNLMTQWLKMRVYARDERDYPFLQPDGSHVINHLPCMGYLSTPQNAVCAKFVHSSINKVRCPITIVSWMPEGRRLVTGSSSGEFTLWNGSSYNFETILQAHDSAVRAMEWSPSGQWFVTADHSGYIKYWQSNMNNLKEWQGHRTPIRGLKFAPTDAKFASCADDATIKIWDFSTGVEERSLTGHGWDIKCLDWHKTKGLIVSGSKDNLMKLWDPRKTSELCTLHGSKNMITSVGFNLNGNYLCSTAKEQSVRIWDLRMLREIVTLKGNVADVNSSDWHPVHPNLLVTGGSHGQICYFHVDHATSEIPLSDELRSVQRALPPALRADAQTTHQPMVQEALFAHNFAHESSVWSIKWHPLGHVLCSGSNDHTTKFWTRSRPGDKVHDRWSIGIEAAAKLETSSAALDMSHIAMPSRSNVQEGENTGKIFLPGLGQQSTIQPMQRPTESTDGATVRSTPSSHAPHQAPYTSSRDAHRPQQSAGVAPRYPPPNAGPPQRYPPPHAGASQGDPRYPPPNAGPSQGNPPYPPPNAAGGHAAMSYPPPPQPYAQYYASANNQRGAPLPTGAYPTITPVSKENAYVPPPFPQMGQAGQPAPPYPPPPMPPPGVFPPGFQQYMQQMQGPPSHRPPARPPFPPPQR